MYVCKKTISFSPPLESAVRFRLTQSPAIGAGESEADRKREGEKGCSPQPASRRRRSPAQATNPRSPLSLLIAAAKDSNVGTVPRFENELLFSLHYHRQRSQKKAGDAYYDSPPPPPTTFSPQGGGEGKAEKPT